MTYAAVTLVRAAAAAGGAGQPPFGIDQKQLGLGGSGPDAPKISIDLSTIRTVPVQIDNVTRTDVLFQVKFLDQGITVWMRAGQVAKPLDYTNSRTLEQALKQMRDDLKQETPTPDQPSPPGPPVAALTPDVKAAIANTPEELLAVEVS